MSSRHVWAEYLEPRSLARRRKGIPGEPRDKGTVLRGMVEGTRLSSSGPLRLHCALSYTLGLL